MRLSDKCIIEKTAMNIIEIQKKIPDNKPGKIS